MESSNEYETQLKMIRHRRRTFLMAIILFMPLVVLYMAAYELVTGSKGDILVPFVFLSGLMAYLSVLVLKTQCPQCDRLFFISTFIYGNVCSRKCHHCGLPLKND